MTQPARTRGTVPNTRLVRVLELVAIVVASLALSIGLIILLSGFFAGRDQAGVAGGATGPGQAFTDLGHRALAPGHHLVDEIRTNQHARKLAKRTL